MRELVRIERIDNADGAPLSASQAYFLRENLRLRLLGARGPDQPSGKRSDALLELLKPLREQTGGELRKSAVDWSKVDGLIEQVARLRGEAQKENLRAILDLESQLTPQQRDKLHAVLAERYVNPPRWSGPPRPPGSGPGMGQSPGGPGPGRPSQ